MAPARMASMTFDSSLDTMKKRGAEIVYLPAKEFSYLNGLHRLTAVAGEVLFCLSDSSPLGFQFEIDLQTGAQEDERRGSGPLPQFLDRHEREGSRS